MPVDQSQIDFDSAVLQISGAGFEILNKVYHPEAFGSWYITVAAKEGRRRLIWDGKEAWFVIDHKPGRVTREDWSGWTVQWYRWARDGVTVDDAVAAFLQG